MVDPGAKAFPRIRELEPSSRRAHYQMEAKARMSEENIKGTGGDGTQFLTGIYIVPHELSLWLQRGR